MARRLPSPRQLVSRRRGRQLPVRLPQDIATLLAAQRTTDAGQQFVGITSLAQVVGRAEAQALDDVGLWRVRYVGGSNADRTAASCSATIR